MRKLILLSLLLCSAHVVKAQNERIFDRDVIMNGTLEVQGKTSLNGGLNVEGNVGINANRFNITSRTGRTSIDGSLNVDGNTTLGALSAREASLDGLSIDNGGDLRVTGSTFLNGQVRLNQNGAIFDPTGTSTFNGDIFLARDKSLYVNLIEPVDPTTSTSFSGNVFIKKSLDVLDQALLHDILRVLGSAIFNGDVSIGGNLTVTGTTNITVRAVPQAALPQKSSAQTAGNHPKAIAFSPLGEFVSTISNGKVEIFAVDALGNISESALSTFTTSNNPSSVAWSPNWSLSSGGFITITNAGNNTVQTLPIDAEGNLSAPVSSRTTGINPSEVSYSALGNYIFIANKDSSSNNIQIFGVDSSGDISPVISTQSTSPFAPESAAWSPNWSPLNGGFMALATDENQLQIRSVDSLGNASSLISSQFTASKPRGISFSPLGDYVAVANESGTIQTFPIDQLGNLSPAISSQITGSSPSRVTWSPNWGSPHGGHIVVTSGNSNLAQIFEVDPSGNISSQVGYANTGVNPQSVAWSPLGNVIGVANSGAGNLIQTFDLGDFS